MNIGVIILLIVVAAAALMISKKRGGPAPTGAAPAPAPAPVPAPAPAPATTGLKCGDRKFCVGNVGGSVACYGDAKACLWQGDCGSDADCKKYTAGSPYYLDMACPPVGVPFPYGRWGWEACAQPTPVAAN